MPYSDRFPYAQTTREIAGWLPPWMRAAKDPNSNFQQFINAFGIELDEIQEDVHFLWNSVFIRTLPEDLVAWVKKAALPFVSGPLRVEGLIEGTWVELEPTERLRDFLKKDEHLYIVDYDNQVIYLRQRYEAARVNGESLALEDHHVWNPFDEFALKARLFRHHLESNESLRKRTLLAFRYPHGVAAPLAAFAGLVRELEWSGPELSLPDEDVIQGTVRVNDVPAYPGQVEGGRLLPRIFPLLTQGAFSGAMLSHGKLVLVPGALRGEWVSELLAPGNLGRWTRLEYEAEGDVKVDLLPRMFFREPGHEPIASGVPSGVPFESVVDEERRGLLERELFVRVRMKKGAVLRSLAIHYEPEDGAKVLYLYGVEVEDLNDPEVKERLKAKEPGKLKELIEELSHAMPLFWDQFIWNESFWDIYDESLVGLDVLDVPWGGSLEGIRHLNPGVGDGEDLLTTSEGFEFFSTPGHFFLGDALDEHYLFGSPKTIVQKGPVQVVYIDPAEGKGPFVVEASYGGESRFLKQVCFLDGALEPGVINEEQVQGTGDDFLLATYAGLDPSTLEVEGYKVDPSRYDGSNRIPLAEAVPEGKVVTVRYGVQDSFALSVEGGKFKITLLKPAEEVRITFEGGGRYRHDFHVDPARTHLTSGFLYIAGKNHPPAEVRLRATPAALIADGKSRASVVVDVLDRFGNPVYDAAPTVALRGVDDDGKTLSDPGSIQLAGSDRGRYTYRYTAPGINKNATVTVEARAGDAVDTQEIRLKEAVEE